MMNTLPRLSRIARIAMVHVVVGSGLGYAPALGWAEEYFPPPEAEGGWRTADPASLGVDVEKLSEVLAFHNSDAGYTQRLGGALLIIYKGYLIAEQYVTGTEGGPQPWTKEVCNDMKSSTKSVLGTAAGVFLEEFKVKVTLDTLLVGTSPETSLIPQIWEQPITDPRKQTIKVKHVLSMTSGHAQAEPWNPPWRDGPLTAVHTPGHTGPFQLYEYCFGWWSFKEVPSGAHMKLFFDPGTDFRYSNFGLEQFALAMKNISGEMVGPYFYDRVLGPIGLPRGVRDNQYRHVPYPEKDGLNFSLDPGWAVGGAAGCNAYMADGTGSLIGPNTIVGSTFRVCARDYARLAYLWLHKGRWGDRQLVPRAWIELATRRHVRADGTTPKDYGYTFWILNEVEGVPNDTFMSHGDRLNDCYVVPSLDLVVMRQGNVNPADRPSVRNDLVRSIVLAIPSP